MPATGKRPSSPATSACRSAPAADRGRRGGDAAVLEFIAATDEANLEDQMALLRERAASGLLEREVSLRLLRHYASSVRHNQYHDTDVITVRVEPAHAL